MATTSRTSTCSHRRVRLATVILHSAKDHLRCRSERAWRDFLKMLYSRGSTGLVTGSRSFSSVNGGSSNTASRQYSSVSGGKTERHPAVVSRRIKQPLRFTIKAPPLWRGFCFPIHLVFSSRHSLKRRRSRKGFMRVVI